MKEFIELYKLLNSDVFKFKRNIKSANLEQEPKKLLLAFHAYKKHQFDQMQELLKIKCQDKNYEQIRLYLLGIMNNQHGKPAFALEYLEQAYELQTSKENEYFKQLILISMCITHYNRKDQLGLKHYNEMLQKYKPVSERMQLYFVQCQALFDILHENYQAAEHLLTKVLESRNSELELFEREFLMMLITIKISHEQFETALDLLERYKTGKGHVVKSNYKFMRSLLDNILFQKPIYAYKRDFEHAIELYQQIMTVKALSEGNQESAQSFWEQLAKHNPKTYQENFKYASTKCLFSISLERYKKHASGAKIDIAYLRSIPNALDKLSYILNQVDAPISKYQLIELIWETEPDEVNLSHLRTLVTQLRRRENVKISSLQGTYKLIKNRV